MEGGINYGAIFGQLQAEAMDAIAAVAPVAIGVLAVFLAVRYGKRLFQVLTGR